jgi:hypothetical protein
MHMQVSTEQYILPFPQQSKIPQGNKGNTGSTTYGAVPFRAGRHCISGADIFPFLIQNSRGGYVMNELVDGSLLSKVLPGQNFFSVNVFFEFTSHNTSLLPPHSWPLLSLAFRVPQPFPPHPISLLPFRNPQCQVPRKVDYGRFIAPGEQIR